MGPIWSQFSLVQSLSCVQLFGTPWTAACQASLGSFKVKVRNQGRVRVREIPCASTSCCWLWKWKGPPAKECRHLWKLERTGMDAAPKPKTILSVANQKCPQSRVHYFSPQVVLAITWTPGSPCSYFLLSFPFHPSPPSGSKIHSVWTRGSQFIPSPHKSVLVGFTLEPHISRGKHQKPKLFSCLNGLLLTHSFSLCRKPPFPLGLKVGRGWK